MVGLAVSEDSYGPGNEESRAREGAVDPPLASKPPTRAVAARLNGKTSGARASSNLARRELDPETHLAIWHLVGANGGSLDNVGEADAHRQGLVVVELRCWRREHSSNAKSSEEPRPCRPWK